MELRALLRKHIITTDTEQSLSSFSSLTSSSSSSSPSQCPPLNLCSKLSFFFCGDLHNRSAYAVLFCAFTIIIFFCFAYFDLVQAAPIQPFLFSFSKIKPEQFLEGQILAFPPSPSTPSNHTVKVWEGLGPISSVNGEGEELEGEEDIEIVDKQNEEGGRCNLFEGTWVKDENYPMYDGQACPFIDEGFRCKENGRPHLGYLKWRWQPSGCDIPRFNARQMLEMLRGSRLVFVGDSIGRNQWESMLCLLSQAVPNKSRIYEVNGQPITKHKGFLIFRFRDYDCTVEYYRSPFLVPQARPPPNSPPHVRTSLKVDTMDWNSKRWPGARVIVFNAGHWWSSDKTRKSGCFFQVGNQVNVSMKVKDGFARAMQTWREWVLREIDLTQTHIFFRTYAPVYFRGGTWKAGGQCNEEEDPFPAGTRFKTEPWTNGVLRQEIRRKLPEARVLDITAMSAHRKDGHPSLYNLPAGGGHVDAKQDCSHWCLPGVPDTWNHVLFATLLLNHSVGSAQPRHPL